MAVLTLGAGLQATLLGVRATLEGLSTFVTGAVMAAYYVGFVIGSIAAPMLVRRVGHIRVFAALTATAAATILVQGVFFGAWTWAFLRIVSGVCFAGIYVVAESWLNDRADRRSRGVLLASYMVVIYVGLGAGQLLLSARRSEWLRAVHPDRRADLARRGADGVDGAACAGLCVCRVASASASCSRSRRSAPRARCSRAPRPARCSRSVPCMRRAVGSIRPPSRCSWRAASCPPSRCSCRSAGCRTASIAATF